MTRRALVLLVCVGCGGDRPGPNAATGAPPPPLPRHAAPTCPLPALAPIVDENAPREGLEGEERLAKPTGGDTCQTADSNLARVEAAILGAPPRSGAPARSKPWDKRRTPERMAQVTRRLALLPAEKENLDAYGFTVLGRHEFSSYAYAYHEIYQSQLPVFVSIDSILHAIYAGNDGLIADLEDRKLAPTLGRVVDALACALPAATADYPAETARDLDLYIAVARALLHGEPPASVFGDASVEGEAKRLVAAAVAAQEMQTVDMFGRKRVVDFTAYTPRGHYGALEPRQRFFRAGMWLSRLEFNLVSRSSRSSQPGFVPEPAETPREDVLALALADLVARAGATADLAQLDTAWSLLAGRREDVSIAQLSELRTKAGIAKLTDKDAATKLRAAIGDYFQRTARIHYMPQGSTTLPAIATLLGPRIVPDAAATRPLVHGEIPGRTRVHAADMAFVLGHDRARASLGDDLTAFPSLDNQLRVAREIVDTAPRGKDDLYSAWMDAVLGLAKPAAGALPSFTRAPAYADLRVNSALAAFGHIKHNYVLMVGESYFEGGCQIPDGYVEPAPAVYEALLDYAARGERAFAALDPADELAGRAYFIRLGHILRVLQRIQNDELADRPLTSDQKSFLSMVAEMSPGTTGGPPTYTGWWFDMFRRRELDGLSPANYIASFFTGETVAYIGAQSPVLGVFVVDTGGAPRVAVGPIARAYEHQAPVARRLDDEAGRQLAATDKLAPWEASYFVPPPPAPKFHISWSPPYPLELETERAMTITLEYFDHHREPLGRQTVTAKAGKTTVRPKLPKRAEPEGVHVQVGNWHQWVEMSMVAGGLWGAFGGWKDE